MPDWITLEVKQSKVPSSGNDLLFQKCASNIRNRGVAVLQPCCYGRVVRPLVHAPLKTSCRPAETARTTRVPAMISRTDPTRFSDRSADADMQCCGSNVKMTEHK